MAADPVGPSMMEVGPSPNGESRLIDLTEEQKIASLRKRRREAASVVHNSMLSLLAVSFLCCLTAGSPDNLLLVGGPSVKVPFAEVQVSLIAFLNLAPLLVLLITVYLHIFFGTFLHLSRSLGPAAEPLPRLFSLDSRLARLLSHVTLYWLTPVILGVIAYKALGRPQQGIPLLCLAIIGAATMSAVYRLRRSGYTRVRLIVSYHSVVVATILISVAVAALGSEPYFRRPLNLTGSDLSSLWLAQTILRKSHLERANLQKTYLGLADLNQADLTAANMTGATLVYADLTSALFMGTKATGANLRKANLTGALLVGADFSNANLEGATMKGIKSSYYMGGAELVEILSKIPWGVWFSDFSGANLRAANLTGADLTQAHLQHADLRNADLRGADLSGADLSGAQMQGARLDRVVYCRTIMPNGKIEHPDCTPHT